MKRLTFDGDFCDISMCQEVRGGPHCQDGGCSQRRVWERLRSYEDTGLEPGEIEAVAGLASENCAKTAAAIDRFLADEKIVKTRGDRFRAMPDEELAHQFGAQCPKENKRACDNKCHLCWLGWLREPAEED